jgi:hypothetical protein
MAQTTKHHTREPGKHDPMTARLTEIRSTPHGVGAQVGWSGASGGSGSEDALDLARRCVRAWRSFFVRRGLA